MMKRRLSRVLLFGFLAAALVACDPSPEAARTQGGGPGADRGNWEQGEVDLRQKDEGYYDTPLKGAGRDD
jgi:hypothetical protein